jgi:hypothetical protein
MCSSKSDTADTSQPAIPLSTAQSARQPSRPTSSYSQSHQPSAHGGRQSSRPSSRQTSQPSSRQASRPHSRQSSRPSSRSSSRPSSRTASPHRKRRVSTLPATIPEDQPEDREIIGNISQLSTFIEQHVENYYDQTRSTAVRREIAQVIIQEVIFGRMSCTYMGCPLVKPPS